MAGLLPGCSSKDKGTNVTQTTEPFESGDLSSSGPTSIFVRTFGTAGSFSYHCRFHSSMTGVVNVATGGADSFIVAITNNAFAAASPIKPGGYVKWVNGGSTHSVTRP
jgi:plastocyanin